MRKRIQTLARIPKRWSKESQLRVQLRKTRPTTRAHLADPRESADLPQRSRFQNGGPGKRRRQGRGIGDALPVLPTIADSRRPAVGTLKREHWSRWLASSDHTGRRQPPGSLGNVERNPRSFRPDRPGSDSRTLHSRASSNTTAGFGLPGIWFA
jgi:hypothetical protein